MSWRSKIPNLADDLGSSLTKDFPSAITRSGSAGIIKIGGLFDASTPLHEYCSAFVPRIDFSQLDDVQKDFITMGRQAVTLSRRRVRWPVVQLGESQVPVSLSEDAVLGPSYAELPDLYGRVETYVERLRKTGLEVVLVDPTTALQSFSLAAAPFLAARLAWANAHPDIDYVSNMEVRNDEDGWNVVYRPALLFGRQIGLGGPGSPVKGYIRPGSYVFGIVKSGQSVRWDTTSWDIPRRDPIHVPLP